MKGLLAAVATAAFSLLPCAGRSLQPSWYWTTETHACNPYMLPSNHLGPLVQMVRRAAVAAPKVMPVSYEGKRKGTAIVFFPKWRVPFEPMTIVVFDSHAWCEKFVADADGYAADPQLLGWSKL